MMLSTHPRLTDARAIVRAYEEQGKRAATMGDVLVIIRTVGERTLSACRSLTFAQGIPETAIEVVEEVPFSQAMRTTFSLGIARNFTYTLCVDADVLLRPGAIRRMVEAFEAMPEHVCEVQGLMMDKFFGGQRPAGNHLYRTSLLPKMLACIPLEGTDIRPETYALQKMAANGHPWVKIDYIVGIHDDEQWAHDIYRKCFVHAAKHLYLADHFIPYWKRMQEADADFKVAIRAFADSIAYQGTVLIDTSQDVYSKGFQASGCVEKALLAADAITPEGVEVRIRHWDYPEEYTSRNPVQFGLHKPEANPYALRHERPAFLLKHFGVVKTLMLYVGVLFTKVGYRFLMQAKSRS
jgi:hypothetical protein